MSLIFGTIHKALSAVQTALPLPSGAIRSYFDHLQPSPEYECLYCYVVSNALSYMSEPNSFSFSQQKIGLENCNQMGSAGTIHYTKCLHTGAHPRRPERSVDPT